MRSLAGEHQRIRKPAHKDGLKGVNKGMVITSERIRQLKQNQVDRDVVADANKIVAQT